MECAGVFLISTEAALFGPSKYGLLPELLPEQRLSWGNGVIELGTFIASILATMAAGILAGRYVGHEHISGLMLLGFTCVGLVTSFGISRVPPADPLKKFRWNPLGDLGAQLKTMRADRVLGWAVLGNSYLFFLAALLQFTIVIYGHDVLHIDDAHTSYLQAAVGIGIGIGSLAAGYLSGGKIEYGLIPLGAVGMTVFGALLYSPASRSLQRPRILRCGEEVVHRFGRDDDGEREVFVVLGHADVVEIGGDVGDGDLGVKFGGFWEVEALAAYGVVGETGATSEDAGDLANAVGAVVEVDDDVVVADEADGIAVRVDAGEGWDELVGDAVVVELFDPG